MRGLLTEKKYAVYYLFLCISFSSPWQKTETEKDWNSFTTDGHTAIKNLAGCIASGKGKSSDCTEIFRYR
jgi:hypothetical protein